MKKPSPRPKKSDVTRQHVLDTALALFRKRGFDATTMRDIAAAADLSLGAAYYYFRSKEAIVSAYYLRVQDRHEERARAALPATSTLRERLSVVMQSKLDVLTSERKLLGVLFRTVGEPGHPLSALSARTKGVRARSFAIFEEAIGPEPLPPDLRALLAPALWMLHMGFLLSFIHDASPRQQKTRDLVEGTLDLVVPLVSLAALPHAQPIRARIAALVGGAVGAPIR